MQVNFTSIDLGENERNAVQRVLDSGWLTTGEVTRGLESHLTALTGADAVQCVNSATAAMELSLRSAGIGVGDTVILPAYTFTATAAAVLHTGADIALCDCPAGEFHITADQIEPLITPSTKCIIGVDIGGELCAYDQMKDLACAFPIQSENPIFKALKRPLVLADAAHSLGAKKQGVCSGEAADISCFSFHATKNITTAEGGAIAWKIHGLDNAWLKSHLSLLSLHGQTRTALERIQGSCDYDILFPGYKCNMTDLGACIARAQLERLGDILAKRGEIVALYDTMLDASITALRHSPGSSYHLYMALLPEGVDRDKVIAKLAQMGVRANLHYKPLPMLTAYKNKGWNEKEFPNAMALYKREISLPLSSMQTLAETEYVACCINKIVRAGV